MTKFIRVKTKERDKCGTRQVRRPKRLRDKSKFCGECEGLRLLHPGNGQTLNRNFIFIATIFTMTMIKLLYVIDE